MLWSGKIAQAEKPNSPLRVGVDACQLVRELLMCGKWDARGIELRLRKHEEARKARMFLSMALPADCPARSALLQLHAYESLLPIGPHVDGAACEIWDIPLSFRY